MPNGIWCTLNERKTIGLPHNLVSIGSDGMGGTYCLKNEEFAEDSEVIVYYPGVTHQEKMASSFGEFFLLGIQDQIEFFDEEV